MSHFKRLNNEQQLPDPIEDEVAKITSPAIKELQKLINENRKLEDNLNKITTKIDRYLSYAQKQISESNAIVEKNNKILKEHEKKFEIYNKKLDQVEALFETTEITLSNVLLAIKQNEYLQAWYPEQNGYKEMKVVGKHPND